MKPQLPKDMLVTDRDGHVVGKMVPGYGFVANGKSLSDATPYDVRVTETP